MYYGRICGGTRQARGRGGRTGSKTGVSPLSVKVEEKLTLTSEFLIVPQRLSDLEAGDAVALLRVQGGGRYLVLDRLGGSV